MATYPSAATPASAKPAPAGFLGRFTVLRGAPRELWLALAIKVVSITAYSVTNKTLVLWLSSDLGFSDEKALGLVAAWSLSLTVGALLVGSLTDAIGLRKTFFLGVWVCLVARTVMAITTLKWLALVCGLFPLAFGEALGTPVLVAAIRRYSSTRQRSVAFSLFYMLMNVGFLAAAYLFDFLRQGLGEHAHFRLLGFGLTTYRVLFLVSLTFEVLLLPLIYWLRPGAEMTDEGLRLAPEPARYRGASLWTSMRLTVRDGARDTFRLLRELVGQDGFYRLLVFLLLIGFLKLLFMQMDYVFPKFCLRELGDGAPIGRISGINYLLIIFIVPLVGALTQRFAAYRMVIVGGAISAASVFIMALPTSWFRPLAEGAVGRWIGHGYLGLTGSVHPYYVMSALYIVVLSVGEAFYSPRVYEYAAAIAPKGQEASYSALSYVPFLLAKLLVGSSGVLLAKYCPEQGPRHSGTLWLIYALAATVAPVGLIALRRYIRVPEAGRASE